MSVLVLVMGLGMSIGTSICIGISIAILLPLRMEGLSVFPTPRLFLSFFSGRSGDMAPPEIL